MRKTLIGISLLMLGATAATAQDATYFITHMSQLTQLWQSAGLTAKYPYRYALVDIDGDGMVNVSDVTVLINCVLGSASYSLDVSDIDGDGTVNVSDVTALINLVLNP